MDQSTGNMERPELLKILCILTFIGSGFSFLSYLLLAFYNELFLEIASSDQFGFFRSDEEKGMIIEIFSLPKIYFLLHSLFYALSLFGAYKMWTLKKAGFHFYAISQISLIIVYKAYIPSAPFPFFALAVTVIFILLYFRNLKYMS
jgi:hypothetical protein